MRSKPGNKIPSTKDQVSSGRSWTKEDGLKVEKWTVQKTFKWMVLKSKGGPSKRRKSKALFIALLESFAEDYYQEPELKTAVIENRITDKNEEFGLENNVWGFDQNDFIDFVL